MRLRNLMTLKPGSEEGGAGRSDVHPNLYVRPAMSQVVAMLQSTEHVGFDLFSPHPTEYVYELLPMAIEQR